MGRGPSTQIALPLEQVPYPAPHTVEQPPLCFVRHPRARRYVIRLTDAGIVRVTIPRWGSRREAEAFAAREQQWIQRQWNRLRSIRATPPPPPSPAIVRELRDRAGRELPPRLRELAAQHGFAPAAVTRISIRNQKWRWGSCSRSGHICLNWRLVTMPAAVRDYVLIHELMHLRRMDHSPAFWKLVAQACPDYKALRAELRAISYQTARP
jgi:predicted metal-dependent hydrolase